MIWPKRPKMVIFEDFSWFFGQPYIVKGWGVLRCVQCIRTLLLSHQKQLFDNSSDFHYKGGPLWFSMFQKLMTPLEMAESWKQKVFWWTELQMDQEFRGYSMFERLNKNFMKIRISLLRQGAAVVILPCLVKLTNGKVTDLRCLAHG